MKRFFVATSRQIKRIESASKSPIFSLFTETLNGMSTIRAYNKKKIFLLKMNEFIDKSMVYTQANVFCNRWLGIRLESCGNLFTLIACLFVIFSRGTISSGITGMIISLSLSVNSLFDFINSI